MPGYVVLPQNQNPLMSMFPQLIMQGLAYKQTKEMVSEEKQRMKNCVVFNGTQHSKHLDQK